MAIDFPTALSLAQESASVIKNLLTQKLAKVFLFLLLLHKNLIF
jgi:hypothetical protein